MTRLPRWAWVSIVAAVVVVGGGIGVGTAVANPPHGDAASATPSATATHRITNAADGPQNPAAATPDTTSPTATPVSVQIPSIGVDSTLESLTKDATGVLTPPSKPLEAGWFSQGVVPGHVGPAVIAGHVDSITAPAVFYRLDELAVGDAIGVTMSDGTVVHFTVTGSEEAPKTAFPTQDVYGPVPTPELRLITCDGTFNTATGHYDQNLIVFADRTSD